MSLIQHIDHLARQPGVLSILVNVPGQIAHRGGHEEALRLAMLMRDELHVDRMSTNTDDITIMVHREPGGTAAVAVITGHEVRKSLRRMIKRCAKPTKAAVEYSRAVEAIAAGPIEDKAIDAAAAFGV